MGFDRIRFMDGADHTSTLIAADKASADTVFGQDFLTLLTDVGYRTRHVVDVARLATQSYLQERVDLSQDLPVEFPAFARQIWYGAPIAERAVEVRPPLADADITGLTKWLINNCQPRDAGPLIYDNRGEQHILIAGGH